MPRRRGPSVALYPIATAQSHLRTLTGEPARLPLRSNDMESRLSCVHDVTRLESD